MPSPIVRLSMKAGRLAWRAQSSGTPHRHQGLAAPHSKERDRVLAASIGNAHCLPELSNHIEACRTRCLLKEPFSGILSMRPS